MSSNSIESEPAAPEISVVIVNWNTAHLLDDCLSSVRAELHGRRSEIIVVDNGSTDHSVAKLAAEPDVRLIALEDNRGYQAACNIGSDAAKATVLLHINSDARMTEGSFETMFAVLQDRPEVGVVGPRLVYEDGSFQRWTAGRLPSLGSLAHSFVLGDRIPHRGVWASTDHTVSGEIGWVSSACLLVRAEVLQAIDGLDESFFAYMDDVDLCDRARDHGWQSWYEPGATVVHLMGGSQANSAGVSPMAVKAIVQWFKLRRGRFTAVAASMTMAFGFLARAVVHLIRRNFEAASANGRGARVALQTGFAT